MKKTIAVLFLLPLLCGCGTTVRVNLPMGGQALRQYPKIYLMMATASGAVSVNSADLGSATATASIHPGGVNASVIGSSIGASHAMSGEAQARLVAQDLAFELASLGFELVDKKEQADAIALFSIGTVRYDPITGWIADQAFLVFKDAKTGSTISSFKAEPRFITPTTKSIVRNIMRAVARQY